MQSNDYKRLARVEAMANAQRAELEDVLMAAYTRACEEKNEQDAAVFARKLRDKLLSKSDKEVTLDRVGLDISGAAAFLMSLKNLFGGAWSTYRRLLRDLPEQEGFPFHIQWPHAPGDENEEVA